ncbi:MAG TPA: hypothetical protein VFD70_23015 [Anaerolineae bacterium]|nr:hypothetical protein [Anaerolineae bacterium]
MKRLITSALIFSTFLSLVFFVTAQAGGMHVSPNNGDYNTEYDVTASGFIPGEVVDTWVNKPNQWRVGQGEYAANKNGNISFSFRPDVTWGAGGFFASAIGRRSGAQVTASFSIGGGGFPLAPCGCRAVLLGNPGGTAVNYNSQGYESSEIVVVYMTDPAAQLHRLPNAQADPWGNLAFPLYLSQDSLYGPYLFTARGLTTGYQSFNTFTFWGGIFNHRSSNPISFATPTFTLNASGFHPQESITIQLTYPSNTTKLLTTLNAGSDGSIHYSYIVPPGSPFGIYTLSGTGAASGNVASARFNWDGVVTAIP